MACTVNFEQNYPFPQMFLVDGGGGRQQDSAQPPSLIPCWSFPPAQERMKSRGKSKGCMGISPGLALVVLFLFLLVFAALGFEAFKISRIEDQLRNSDGEVNQPAAEFSVPQKQIGLDESGLNGQDKSKRSAAHVIGRIENKEHPKTLRWDSRTSRAFISGAVAYLTADGALQVNETGIYHIYSRVELIFMQCSPTSAFDHTVFVRRAIHTVPLTLMTAHRGGFCPQQTRYSWTKESYLGSVQLLEKYDRVYVNVSHPKYLSHSHYGNFFGLYKI
ncbi:tumor necrosis factor ligand superfamily member 6 [Neolamprologus brichardi]|uniref:tumor necrosis factor ligand superfamily member 6 n=1 Tax=Neolamprologus brichardi TaxID=32507 RepID=UPI0003EC0AC1|nr:tumor necrosis factor ligand superfamily member 6 [Neolamprologus brichardi]